MVQVSLVERKSAVLTPSSLACLAHVSTINLTAGCAHECRYCYARGYLTHPGEGRVALYTNTLAKLREREAEARAEAADKLALLKAREQLVVERQARELAALGQIAD